MRVWSIVAVLSVFAVAGCAGTPSPEGEPAAESAAPAEPAARGVPQTGDVVRIHHTGRLQDGTEFETTRDRQPTEFTLGEGQLIPRLEEAVLDLEVGQATTVRVPAEEAYGPRDPELVFEVERERFPPDLDVQPGQQVQGQLPDGSVGVFTIVDFSESTVTLDGNHVLAGQDLIFEIELISIE